MMRDIFLSVFETSLSTGIMIVFFILFSPLLVRRYAAKWKYWVWLFLALWLVIPMKPVKDMGSRWNKPLIEIQPERTGDTFVSAKDAEGPIVVEIPTRIVTGIAPLSDEGSKGLAGLELMAAIWLCGGISYISMHIFSYFHYRKRLMKQGTPVKDEEILRQLSLVKEELCIKNRIAIWKYSRAASPMLIGFLKPVLVLPEEEYNKEELFFIIKHELVHFKRHDIWMKLLLVVANGIHWFNPVVWIMQKEAVIDMEMSCDERVVQNIGYAGKKAYAEALFSTLHRRYAGKTLLSTQFQGGKQIMKKRFKNIILGKKKRNGLLLLTGIAVLTMSMGMLVGCSVGESQTDSRKDSEMSMPAEGQMADEQQEAEEAAVKPDGTGRNEGMLMAEAKGASEKTVLTCNKEGETELIPATIHIGNGFSIYIPDEGWNLSDLKSEAGTEAIAAYSLDAWQCAVNENVRLWIAKGNEASAAELASGLLAEGWEETGALEMVRQDGEMVYHVRLVDGLEECYGIYYCFPSEAEEGFGRELTVIADTFAISIPADAQEILLLSKEFSTAYFNNDVDSLKQYLSDSYSGEIDGFPGGEGVLVNSVKGLKDFENKEMKDSCSMAIEFKERETDDFYQYLTMELVKEESGWKIEFYGLEM